MGDLRGPLASLSPSVYSGCTNLSKFPSFFGRCISSVAVQFQRKAVGAETDPSSLPSASAEDERSFRIFPTGFIRIRMILELFREFLDNFAILILQYFEWFSR